MYVLIILDGRGGNIHTYCTVQHVKVNRLLLFNTVKAKSAFVFYSCSFLQRVCANTFCSEATSERLTRARTSQRAKNTGDVKAQTVGEFTYFCSLEGTLHRCVNTAMFCQSSSLKGLNVDAGKSSSLQFSIVKKVVKHIYECHTLT